MTGSLRLGRPAGIELRIHWSFLLLILWMIWQGSTPAADPEAAGGWGARDWISGAWAAAMTLAVFTCVTLHELGHSFAARAFGIRTHRITLYPIGGIASLTRLPAQPGHEVAIALAGPAVNLVLAAVLALGRGGFPTLAELLDEPSLSWAAASLTLANLILAGFNLLPAFPMDGGRVLRALLAMRYSPARATTIAAWIGQSFAVALFALASWQRLPFLAAASVFLIFTARREQAYVALRENLRALHVDDLMRRPAAALSPDDPLARCAELQAETGQEDFPVLAADGRLVGLVTGPQWRGLRARGEDGQPVAAVMLRHFAAVASGRPAAEIFGALLRGPQPAFPVLADGRVIGLLERTALAGRLGLGTAGRPPARRWIDLG